ncbi:hypothetical protein BX661DRAFT_181829 [Kickxella alabastrina]|uniref:uncharacterized protein n=1 Tax=Kickxella alabastrina TaxID=61397 RepID=UPI00221E4278|nr:uncharacterized protein BX661DRAFT_181829 [Kickxella alabastrina]KAI7828295.1 hypothetical protein BX661DRAFT_181829 [Kickxella alabastrina]
MYCLKLRSATSSRSCCLILREILRLDQPCSSHIHQMILADCGRIGTHWLQLLCTFCNRCGICGSFSCNRNGGGCCYRRSG